MCKTPKIIKRPGGPRGWIDQPIACGRCWQCRQMRVNDFVGRSLAEAAVSDWTLAITLTYAPRDDFADRRINPAHFQAFVRSMRRRLRNKKNGQGVSSVRYLVAGEYGSKKGRAHFHALLFGRGARPDIKPHKTDAARSYIADWPHGHVNVDWQVDERAVRYVCKYLLKDDRDDSSEIWLSMSKKPPLGHEWLMSHADRTAAAGIFPRRLEYQPPGAVRHKSRRYVIQNTTRRDYLKRLIGGLGWSRERIEQNANERLQPAVAKHFLREHEEAWSNMCETARMFYEGVQMQRRIEDGRPSARTVWEAMLPKESLDLLHQAQKMKKTVDSDAERVIPLEVSVGNETEADRWRVSRAEIAEERRRRALAEVQAAHFPRRRS